MEPIAIPSFTAEQATSLQAFITANNKVLVDQMRAMMEEMMDARLGPVQSTPPAPKEPAISEEDTEITAEKQEQEPLQQAISEEDAEITAEKQEQRPLYQASVEDIEDDAEHGSSMTTSKSMLSTKSRLCTAPTSGDPAACLSKALLFASLTSCFGSASFLASLFGFLFGSFFGYSRCMDGMEASGQG